MAAFTGACGSRSALYVQTGVGPEGFDASDDRGSGDDGSPPPIDGFFADTPLPEACPDASTVIYLVTQESELLSFYPPTLAFTSIGRVSCPGTTTTPWSMAVDRQGTGYSVFQDGHLFAIDMSDAGCRPTAFVPGQSGFSTFGMGFTALPDGGERLFAANDPNRTGTSTLGWIDTSSFALTPLAAILPTEQQCELSGTGDGRLFGFCLKPAGGSSIVQIDPSNAQVVSRSDLGVGQSNVSWAFASWGGVFWIFTGTSAETTVTRWDPSTGSETSVATHPGEVVGAGVSTCAPL
jgi:hypothetical protein